jgi:uncharacterized delta-60 repeat protein
MKLRKIHPLISLAALATTTAVAMANPGSLDTTFNTTGLATANYGGTETANAVAVMPNGKIVVAGTTNTLGNNDIAVLRYNANGTLDTTFSSDGGTITDVETAAGASTEDFAQAVAVQPDGKILVAGYTNAGGANDFLLVRYNVDGSLDTFFGAGGRAIFNYTANDQATSVIVLPNGKILVGGTTDIGNAPDFTVVRYNSDGSPDTTFGSGGHASSGFGQDDFCQAMAVQQDGKIVLAGYTNTPGTNDFAVARFTADGVIDTTFNTTGQVVTPFGSDDRANSVAIQADGKIVVAGSWNGGLSEFALARYNTTGSLDTSFSLDGKANASFAPTGFGLAEFGNSLALQPDGRIIVGGYTNQFDANNDFGIMRFKSDGTLDTSLDTDGKLTTGFGTGTADQIKAIALQSDGKLVVVGSSGTDFAAARYNMLIKTDALVGTKATATGGNNIYNSTGAGQTLNITVKKAGGKTVSFVKIQNDSDDSQAFTIKGTTGNSDLAVKYFNGATDVTATVAAGTFNTSSIASGASFLLKVQVTAKTKKANKTRSFFVTGRSVTDPASSDTVLISAKSK